MKYGYTTFACFVVLIILGFAGNGLAAGILGGVWTAGFGFFLGLI